MGCSSFKVNDYKAYNTSLGRSYDEDFGVLTNGFEKQSFKARSMDPDLDPENVMRECCNTEEHPNTIPVILALDVTGSMGKACEETVRTLGGIMTSLYSKFKDVEIMVMGIGDLAYDRAPIQISQFESDVRIAEWLDKIYLEFGGGGNRYESYTAAWYMGLHHTKLDCFDKQGRKGIIITLGDEMLNPYLPGKSLNRVTGDSNQSDINTDELYKEASKKFDIYHIAVDSVYSSFRLHEQNIRESFSKLLGQNFIVSTIENLSVTICDCIASSVEGTAPTASSDEITW